MDKHGAGIRKCKPGTCIPRLEGWDEELIRSPTKKKEKEVNVSKEDENDMEQETRCGHCNRCRQNCELAQRKSEDWCDLCVRRKAGEKIGRGCKKRELCRTKASWIT